jgi:hypothetical protein
VCALAPPWQHCGHQVARRCCGFTENKPHVNRKKGIAEAAQLLADEQQELIQVGVGDKPCTDLGVCFDGLTAVWLRRRRIRAFSLRAINRA